MKRNNLLKIIILSLSFCLFAILGVNTTTKIVNAETTTEYEEADVISIGDIADKKSISMLSPTRYQYKKTATRGSLIFKFDLENIEWTEEENFQIYFVVNDGSSEPWWNDDNLYIFRVTNTYLKTSETDTSYNSTDAISSTNHSIELGRLAIKENGSYNGTYYVYIKVDGELILNSINTYDYTKLDSELLISGRATNKNKLVDPNFVEPTYEVADEISVSDLYLNKKSVGNKIGQNGSTAYSYTRTAAYGSVIFSFTYKNTKWTQDDHGAQIHFYKTYQEHGMAWLRPDAIRIAYKPAKNVSYVTGNAITSGTHEVEIGRLAILKGEEFTGSHYIYVKIDGTVYVDKVIQYTSSDQYLTSSIFITGSNGNLLLDKDWNGDHVSYKVNGQITNSFITTEEHLTKPQDPEEIAGKRFIGWFDEFGNKWDFENDSVSDNLVLTAGYETILTEDDDTYFNDSTYTPVLRFILGSDTHISQGSSVRNTYLAHEFDVAYGYAKNSTTYNALDAALYVGDVSDDGSAIALASFNSIVEANIKDGTALLVTMGNHDYRGGTTEEAIANFVDLFDKVDFHVIINGYHFIGLSPDLSEGCNFSDSKVKWLDAELAKAVEADSTKPIFVMQHEAIKGTIEGSTSWGVTELTDVLCKYPQVVDFSGHSHHPLTDPRSVWQGTFTALGTGTLHYYEFGINGYRDSGVKPSDRSGGWSTSASSGSNHAEFSIVEVDANGAIRVIVYDLENDVEIKRIYIRNVMDERKITYSFEERASQCEAPYFNNSTLTATSHEDTITVDFNQATCDNTYVESYRIELYVEGKLTETKYALSDYCFYPMPEKITYTIPYLRENTEYSIKIYAVNIWNQVSEDYLQATVKTGEVPIHEDIVEEITLRDIYMRSGSTPLTTETVNAYLEVCFHPSENNYYGSFKLQMQLLYLGEDFQICFDEDFANSDLVWINQEGQKVWYVKDGVYDQDNVSIGLHTITFCRYHVNEGKYKGYTAFYVQIDDNDYHTCYSELKFSTNGRFCLNFRGCYAAGSRYYNIDDVVKTTTTPIFEKGHDIEVDSPIENWNTIGGVATFYSTSPSLEFSLKDENGVVSNKKTFEGKFILGTTGSFYYYEIKTNQFELAETATGNEKIVKFCCSASDWEIGDYETHSYVTEKLDEYDTVGILDIQAVGNEGIITNVSTESEHAYEGTSPSYSVYMHYYLVTEELDKANCEFRMQAGKLWTYFCTLWFQTGNPNVAFFGFNYTNRTTEKASFSIQPYGVYEIEQATIYVTEGEWAGYLKTYLKIDGVTLISFYGNTGECDSTNYTVSYKMKGGYSIADLSLGRTIEYIVDGNVYQTVKGVNGIKTLEPDAPTKQGYYFTGWYTEPTGGKRINFNNAVNSEDTTVKYYARFSDTKYDVKFYSEDEEYQIQEVGKEGQAIVPATPAKYGEYKYDFVAWIDRATGKEYDFTTPVTKDVILDALFEERHYAIVYLVNGLEYQTRYYLESDPTTIIDGEPDTPEYIGAQGYWVYSAAKTNKDIYANAKYNGVETVARDEIQLAKFDGATLDIADDLTRFYLNFVDTEEQTKWLETYPVAGGHERQDISFTWTDSSNNKNYLVYFADNANFENAFIVSTKVKSIDYVGIFTPGTTYYWKVIGKDNGYASSIDTFTILNTPVRWISAGTVYNMRDIGGWTTIDGKTVNYELIYRGGQLSIDQSGEKSYMNDFSYQVFDYLGIKTEIELRGDHPHEYNQFNELANLVFVNGTGYLSFFTMGSSSKAYYKKVFTALADKSNYPLYFHCSWGADRTGGLGFLINAVLGVPYEQLVQDYELTSLSYSGRRTRYGYDDGGFSKMYLKFMEDYSRGGTLKDAVYNYLVEYIGVTPAEIDSLRNIMLSDGVNTYNSYVVTYKVDGEVYQQSKVFEGGTVNSIAPTYLDKHLVGWTLNGKAYDLNTPVTSDLVLEAVYEKTIYEDYDVITLRDLGLEEGYTPDVYHEVTSGTYSYEGISTTGGRMFEFLYKIEAKDGTFDDGIHIELGSNTWNYKAHVWIMGTNSQHLFTNGEKPTTSYTYNFEYGKTYKIAVGVIMPLNGENAGKKLFLFIVDDEIIGCFETQADVATTRLVNFAGTEGALYSVDNKMKVTFYNENGSVISTQEVTRGEYATSIANPKKQDQVFLGWFDNLGNKWDFENNKVYKEVELYARFGDRTIVALVVDNNGVEIIQNYEVKVNTTIGDLTLPPVSDPNLEFDGWYEGTVKLRDSDYVYDGMNLICRYKAKEADPVDPVEPENPTFMDKINELLQKVGLGGCKSSLTSGYIMLGVITLAGILLLLKRKKAGVE